MLTIRGRVLQVATRNGDPGRPPLLLLLCNGIGARLELFQPFVNALDPRRAIIRFEMPGIGESPAPVVPYHLAALAPLPTWPRICHNQPHTAAAIRTQPHSTVYSVTGRERRRLG